MKNLMGVPGVDFTVEDLRPTLPAQLEITPLKEPPDATIRVPGSKSVTSRALIIAALAGDISGSSIPSSRTTPSGS